MERRFVGFLLTSIFLIARSKCLRFLCTIYRDDSGDSDPSSNPGDIEDVLKLIQDWDPRCKALVKQTPSCTNWKLLYRDPLPTWVSEHGRIVLIGDAAHPILPYGCTAFDSY